MDIQTLTEWDVKRIPASPKKQWAIGLLFVFCVICALLLFIFHKKIPLPYPGAALAVLFLALLFWCLGIVAYKKSEARVNYINIRCLQCSNVMEECVVNMQESQLDRAVLSRTGLLQRFIVKDKLLVGFDKRIYMIGKKSYTPGQGYEAWDSTAFLLKAKWLVCHDCKRSFIQDTLFEVVAKGDEEVKALMKDKKEIG